MVKLIALLRRKPGMTRQAFKERWLLEHTKLSSQLPGCIEYRLNVALDHQPEDDGAEPPFDGTAELWWENVEAMEAAFATVVAKVAGDDADAFCSARIHIYTEEFRAVRDGTPVLPPEGLS
jgi:uncharacterized protein (TIGR02118 family)